MEEKDKFTVFLGNKKLEPPVKATCLDIGKGEDHQTFSVSNNEGKIVASFELNSKDNEEAVKKITDNLLEFASEAIRKFRGEVNEAVKKIITQYIGLTLEEAKWHDIHPVFSKDGCRFYGVWYDGFMYSCEGARCSIEWPYLENVINEYDRLWQGRN